MDNEVSLNVAIANIDSTLEILKGNPSYDILTLQLNSARLILEGQLNSKPNKVKQLKKPVRKLVNDPAKKNTYKIEELVTTGWNLVDKKLTSLSKEDASKKIQNLIDNESYNPSDLRVVVDGQI
tara:strand:- start:472 stop:843 length:372 start_codon:yes stop_codon:yes gene_type:complete